MESVILKARNLAKSYLRGGEWIPVLKGVNLDIHSSDRIAVMGSSGAGKSTLLHILGTLDRPTGGQVLFGDQEIDLWKKSDDEISTFRNLSMGFVFQFHYLLPELNALENVMLPALIGDWDRDRAENRAKEILGLVGLNHRLLHRPAEMSGGEQQRVAIARSMVLKPRILFADELTGNLDSENGKKVMDILIDLNKTLGVAILIVTHDAEVAQRMDRIFVMKDGELVTS